MLSELIDNINGDSNTLESIARHLRDGESARFYTRSEHWSALSFVFVLWLLQYVLPVYFIMLVFGNREATLARINCTAVLLAAGLVSGRQTAAVTSKRLLILRNGRIEHEIPLQQIVSMHVGDSWITQTTSFSCIQSSGRLIPFRLWVLDNDQLAAEIQAACQEGDSK